jgi:hydrogenase/urease accessory protein HupE
MLKTILHGSTVLVILSSAAPASAHPGHGHGPAGQGSSAVHYFTEPMHFAQFLSIALAVFLIGWSVARWQLNRTSSSPQTDARTIS